MARFLQFFNGFRMPTVGLGTYGLVGETCKKTIDQAMSLGYRHFDTAYSYNNEKDIGEVLSFNETQGTVRRNDLFLTTKIPPIYLAPSDVEYCVRQSLEDLKVKYLDLVLIHSPWGLKNKGDGDLKPRNISGELEFEHYDLADTWKALESLVNVGAIRSIGVSNFNVLQLERILSTAKIRPSNVQLECHVYHQQRRLQSFCASHNITLAAYSPLGSPDRPAHHRLDDHPVLLDDSVIQTVAKNYKKTPAQILLRWLLQAGFAVIPKSQNYDRLKQNIELFDFNISTSDADKIQSLDKELKYFHFQTFKSHPEFHEGEHF